MKTATRGGGWILIGAIGIPVIASGQVTLPEVRVTAERLDAPASTQSSTTVVVDGDQALVDDLTELPGITVVQSGPEGANASVFSRGTNSGHTLFVLDGVPINDPVAPGGAMNVGGLTATGLGAIEVIRGPGTLYGSQAIGATVALHTAAPTEDGVSLGASGGYPWQRTLDGKAALVGETYAWQTTVSDRHKEDFYIDARRFPGASRDQGYGASTWTNYLSWMPHPDHDLTLTTRWTDQDGSFSPRVADPNGAFESEHAFVALQWQFRAAEGWETSLRIGYSGYDRQFTDAPDARSPNSQDVHIGSTRLYAGLEQSAQLGMTSLKIGVEAIHDDVTNVGAFGSAFGVSTTDLSAAETNYAGWVSAVHQAGPVTISGGLRADLSQDFGFHAAARAGAAVAIGEGTVLRASFGSAFKAPSLEDRYAVYAFAGVPNFTGNPNLLPETSRTFEVGIEHDFAPFPANAGLTAYHTRLDDLITFSTDTTINLNQATIYGLELFAEAEVVDGLTLNGSFAWTVAEDGDDRDLLRRPHATAGLGVTWMPLEALTIEADLNWTGTYADISRTTFLRIWNGQYTTLDASMAYEVSDNVAVELVGTNLTDANYEPADGYQAAGLEVRAGLRVTF